MAGVEDEWNAAAFDERVASSDEWQAEEQRRMKKSKKPSRVQDIALAVDTSRHQPKKESSHKQWPFESSPCRMFGGKNTKRGSVEADEMNKEYFDPNFVDRATGTSKFDDCHNDGKSVVTVSSDDACLDDDDDSFADEEEHDSAAKKSGINSNRAVSNGNGQRQEDNKVKSLPKNETSNADTNSDDRMEVDECDYGYGNDAIQSKRPSSVANVKGRCDSNHGCSNSSNRAMAMPRRVSTGGGPIAAYVGAGAGGYRTSGSSLQRSTSFRFNRRGSVDNVPAAVQRTASSRLSRRSSVDVSSSTKSSFPSSRMSALATSKDEFGNEVENNPSSYRRSFSIRNLLTRAPSKSTVTADESSSRLKHQQEQEQPQQQQRKGTNVMKGSTKCNDDDDESPKRKKDGNVNQPTTERSSKHQRRQEESNPNGVIKDVQPLPEEATRGRQGSGSASSSSATRGTNRSSSGSGREGLDSVTYHGDNTGRTSRNSRAAPSSRRSGGPVRHKSSDDPAVMLPGQHNGSSAAQARRSSRNDDLGTATLHGTSGKSAVSRIRGTGTKSSQNGSDSIMNADSSSKGSRRSSTNNSNNVMDRRAKFKRAMSTENVRRPEEYGPDGGKGEASAYGNTATVETATRRRGGRRSVQGATAPETKQELRAGSRSTQPQSRQYVEEKDSSETSSSGDENMDSEQDSFADEGEIEQYRSSQYDQQQKLRSGNKQRGSTGTSSSRRTSSSDQPARRVSSAKKPVESRDILELLHDDKTIKLSDMQDKCNRGIIHFLLYEHKMGISLAQMKKSIQQDILEDPDEALRRLPLPLYVAEPTN